jgi:energy-converting hydrogenase Eha subunit B
MGSIVGRLLAFVLLPFVIASVAVGVIAKWVVGKNDLMAILIPAITAGISGMLFTGGVALSTDTSGSLSAKIGKFVLLLALGAAIATIFLLL